MRANKGDLQIRVGLFHPGDQTYVAGKPGGAGKEDQKFVLLAQFNRLFSRDVVRRSIEQARSFQHSSRISQPYRVPIRLNFTGGRPARTGPPVEVLKGRRIEE